MKHAFFLMFFGLLVFFPKKTNITAQDLPVNEVVADLFSVWEENYVFLHPFLSPDLFWQNVERTFAEDTEKLMYYANIYEKTVQNMGNAGLILRRSDGYIEKAWGNMPESLFWNRNEAEMLVKCLTAVHMGLNLPVCDKKKVQNIELFLKSKPFYALHQSLGFKEDGTGGVFHIARGILSTVNQYYSPLYWDESKKVMGVPSKEENHITRRFVPPFLQKHVPVFLKDEGVFENIRYNITEEYILVEIGQESEQILKTMPEIAKYFENLDKNIKKKRNFVHSAEKETFFTTSDVNTADFSLSENYRDLLRARTDEEWLDVWYKERVFEKEKVLDVLEQ